MVYKNMLWLDELGLKELGPQRLQACFAAAQEAILIEVKKPGLAYDSLIKPLSFDALAKINPGTRVVVGNFGGTNWQAGEAVFDGQRVNLDILSTKTFLSKERQFKSPEAFAGEMVEMLSAASPERPGVAAISFGFQQRPVRTEYGLDTIVPVDDPAKYWQVRGLAGRRIGELIIKGAKAYSWNISRIYIANDTIATALDYPGARFGFVGGSGTNGCLAHPDFKDGHLLNLEAGKIPIFPETQIIRIMRNWGWLPNQENLAEFLTGGDFLIRQLAAVAKYLEKMMGEDLSGAFLEKDSSLVSLCAREEKGRIEELLGRPVKEETFMVLTEASKRILGRAGQTMAVILAAMVKTEGGESPVIPAEGSVLWKGEQVLATVQLVMGQLLERDCKPVLVEAVGTRGIATYSLCQSA